MAANVSSGFDAAVSYALEKLGSLHLSLKKEQLQAIQAVYEGKSVFVCLPTGFGKSVCYMTLPFVMDYKLRPPEPKSSSIIVVSPLISLMVDQVHSLRAKGVKSSIITSSHDDSDLAKDLTATEASLTRDSVLFCAPEALVLPKWRESLEDDDVSERVVALVVDEAHCVSKWSKDFRPSYGRVAEIRAFLPPRTPLMACTATATQNISKEVISSLQMHGCVRVTASPDRPNIFYDVKPRVDIETDFSSLLNSLRENTVQTPRVIVYCRSLNMCADLYSHFHFELGSSSYYPPGAPQLSDNRLFGMFHSCTPQYNKDVILRSLSTPGGVVRVVFATVALGMGVNLQGVNSIIHYGAPSSIDDYFQESGRGGRTGDRAFSTIFWKKRDCPVRAEPTTVRHHEVAAVRRYLENTSMCRRLWLLDYFDPQNGKPGADPQSCCDVCAASVNRA